MQPLICLLPNVLLSLYERSDCQTQVKAMTLITASFTSGVLLRAHGIVHAASLAQTEQNRVIINVIYTCAFPAKTSQIIWCKMCLFLSNNSDAL